MAILVALMCPLSMAIGTYHVTFGDFIQHPVPTAQSR